MLATNTARSRRTRNSTLVRFQRADGPTPSASVSTTISGMNTELKYGGPTEILPPPVTASYASGYSVPSNTTDIATTSSTLFSNSNTSRESPAKCTRERISGTRTAYNVSEPPTTTPRNARMKRPRFGSTANACTDVSTPERTMNAPSSDNENAPSASSTVQLLNAPRFSVTANEWIKAVPISHGM